VVCRVWYVVGLSLEIRVLNISVKMDKK